MKLLAHVSLLKARPDFRGDSAAASLKPEHHVPGVVELEYFRGDSAAASLKLQNIIGATGINIDFRGDSAAASLKLDGECGFLAARRISAAIPPRPH